MFVANVSDAAPQEPHLTTLERPLLASVDAQTQVFHLHYLTPTEPHKRWKAPEGWGSVVFSQLPFRVVSVSPLASPEELATGRPYRNLVEAFLDEKGPHPIKNASYLTLVEEVLAKALVAQAREKQGVASHAPQRRRPL